MEQAWIFLPHFVRMSIFRGDVNSYCRTAWLSFSKKLSHLLQRLRYIFVSVFNTVQHQDAKPVKWHIARSVQIWHLRACPKESDLVAGWPWIGTRHFVKSFFAWLLCLKVFFAWSVSFFCSETSSRTGLTNRGATLIAEDHPVPVLTQHVNCRQLQSGKEYDSPPQRNRHHDHHCTVAASTR